MGKFVIDVNNFLKNMYKPVIIGMCIIIFIVYMKFINKHIRMHIKFTMMICFLCNNVQKRAYANCMCHFPHFACKLPQKEHAKQQTPKTN